ncbi:MAG: hypothetical protein E6J15_04665, partial [Chloroflexi bacterium]
PPGALGLTASLKEDQLVLVTEDDGSLPLGAMSPLGLYYHDTQYLSGYALRVNGSRPLLLSANTEQNYVATFQLMHSEGAVLGTARHAADTLSIRRTRFLADGLRERIGVLNANAHPVDVKVELEFEAAFRDMFAVRAYRDLSLAPLASTRGPREGGLVFERVGRDGVRRTTEIVLRPAPDAIEGNVFRVTRTLGPQEFLQLELAAIPREDGAAPAASPDRFDDAIDALNARYRRFLRSCSRYTTSSETLDEGLITRSGLDLRALLEFHPSGPYPTAGIPWYAVPFGRDGLISAYQTLGWNPDIARGTLRLLASHQGHKVDDFTEEEPGKIFHELRRGELARLGEVPHHPYYGSVDSTPLFGRARCAARGGRTRRSRSPTPTGSGRSYPRRSWRCRHTSTPQRWALPISTRSMATRRAPIAFAARPRSSRRASSATSGWKQSTATRRRSTGTRSRCRP